MTSAIRTTGINQLDLAGELGVSDRRIRQLVQEFVLPAADNDTGLFDPALCRERYNLYRNGTTRDWDQFFDDSIAESNELQPMLDATEAAGATIDDVRAASQATQSVFARMNFLTACRSKSDAEREFHFLIWKQQENQVLGGLLHRAMELSGLTHLRLDTGELIEVIPRGAVPPRRPTQGKPAKPTAKRKKQRRAARAA